MLNQTSNFCLKPDLLKSLLDPHDIHHEGKNNVMASVNSSLFNLEVEDNIQQNILYLVYLL